MKLDLVFRQSDIDWLNFPIRVWSISYHDIDHIQSGEGKARVVSATPLVIRRLAQASSRRRVDADSPVRHRHSEREPPRCVVPSGRIILRSRRRPGVEAAPIERSPPRVTVSQ